MTQETSQENKTEPVFDENSSGLPSEPKPDLDPLVAWEGERHSQLISMFPEVCPDYLLNMVQVKKPDKEGQGTSSAQEKFQTVCFGNRKVDYLRGRVLL